MVDLPWFKNVRYLTVAEVALAMRVSKMTVYRLIHAGGLHSVRFGKSYRVPEQAMEEYLIAEQHAATPPALKPLSTHALCKPRPGRVKAKS